MRDLSGGVRCAVAVDGLRLAVPDVTRLSIGLRTITASWARSNNSARSTSSLSAWWRSRAGRSRSASSRAGHRPIPGGHARRARPRWPGARRRARAGADVSRVVSAIQHRAPRCHALFSRRYRVAQPGGHRRHPDAQALALIGRRVTLVSHDVTATSDAVSSSAAVSRSCARDVALLGGAVTLVGGAVTGSPPTAVRALSTMAGFRPTRRWAADPILGEFAQLGHVPHFDTHSRRRTTPP